MIITIGGDAGSGKTTVSEMLAKKLKYSFHSMGTMFRRIAIFQGLPVEELEKHASEHPHIDKDLDDFQKKLGENEDNFVLESRLGWKFIPHSFKIFLKVDEELAAERVLKDHLDGKRKSEREFETLKEALAAIRQRRKLDLARYKKLYKVNHLDPKHYDLVIDTTGKTVEQVTKEILDELKKRK